MEVWVPADGGFALVFAAGAGPVVRRAETRAATRRIGHARWPMRSAVDPTPNSPETSDSDSP